MAVIRRFAETNDFSPQRRSPDKRRRGQEGRKVSKIIDYSLNYFICLLSVAKFFSFLRVFVP